MRKAYALTEVLIMLSVIVVISFMCTEPIRTIIADMKQSQKDLQKNVGLLHMLRNLHDDVEKAVNLPERSNGMLRNDKVLLIEAKDKIISYQLEEDKVIKTIFPAGSGPLPEEEMWFLSGANINWAVWENNGSGYAVEVSTSIDRKSRGKMHQRLKNSHVYFAKAKTKDKR
ncbi:MAG: hypothetical protein JW912_00800 [Sedimentisphaerales bacterium]|nr:hypothetical protein [Sedimentisphaerales bacterium]